SAPDVRTMGKQFGGNPKPVNANFCAIGTEDGFSLSATSANNLPIGAQLLLGQLADNGGPTPTIMPNPESPLINAGSNPAGLPTDQRGPGHPRSSGPGPDIGAVEVVPPAEPPSLSTITVNDNTPQRSQVTKLTVAFDEPVVLAPGALQLGRLNTG